MLAEIPPARLFEEVLKLLQTGHGVASFEQLRDKQLLKYLFPLLAERLHPSDNDHSDTNAERFVLQGLANTDARIANEQPVTPAFIYAVFLWHDVVDHAQYFEADGADPVPALHLAADEVIAQQLSATSLPRRYSVQMREIWALQPRLNRTKGVRAKRLLANPRFRAAYDFLCLRAEANETNLQDLCSTWDAIQQRPEAQALLQEAKNKNARKRGRRNQNNQRNRSKNQSG